MRLVAPNTAVCTTTLYTVYTRLYRSIQTLYIGLYIYIEVYYIGLYNIELSLPTLPYVLHSLHCVSQKEFTLFVFALTKSDINQF